MKIIITSGGTSEPIDKVRKITNMSKGTLGSMIAGVAGFDSNVEKVYYLGPNRHGTTSAIVEHIETTDTQSVHDELHRLLTTEKIDAVIHAMAISDYTVDHAFTLDDMAEALVQFLENGRQTYHKEHFMEWFKEGNFRLDNSSKISSKSDDLYIKLKPTEKIIAKIKQWSPDTILVGFKLLENVPTEELLKVGRGIMEKNECEYVFTNDIRKIRASGHQGHLISRDGTALELHGLEAIARTIVSHVVNHKVNHA